LKTPDLLSRLRLAPSIALEPPDDALLKAVLVKLFVDRQLVVDTSVVEYLALRIERSLAAAAAAVARLDNEALSRGRRITRPMAAAVVGESGPDSAD
jgi:chromosomal replication initiation ATPase DnaA